MKKILTEIIFVLITGAFGIACAILLLNAGGNSKAFLETSGLKKMEEALHGGASIWKVCYDDRVYGSLSCFVTEDRSEMEALWETVRVIRIGREAKASATDRYQIISFFLDDGSVFSISFEEHLLCTGSRTYRLYNDIGFWSLTGWLKGKTMRESTAKGY